MLRIPYGHHLRFIEMVCESDHEWYIPAGQEKKLPCPFCLSRILEVKPSLEALDNGAFCVYVKPEIHNCSKQEA